jgi:uncharacterized spore protein YtfJ
MSESYVKILVEELSKVISIDSVVGEPIVQEDKVLIPVSRIGFGLGAGSGRGREREGAGEGGGGGGGIEPVAVIAVFKGIPGPEGVQVLQLKAPSRIPEVIEKAVGAFAKMKEKEAEEGAEK